MSSVRSGVPSGVHGAHGDHIRIVAGSGDGAIADGAGRSAPAVIAGRDHHHDAGLPRLFDGLAKRIGGVALKYAAAQREVDDADVVRALELDGGVDRRDDVAIVTVAVVIENAETDEVDARGDTLERVRIERPGGIGAIPGDDSGHMSAVAEDIGGIAAVVADEVLSVDHVARRQVVYRRPRRCQ